MIADLDALGRAEAEARPYPHLVVPDFLAPERQRELSKAFPRFDAPGLFLPDAAAMGAAMADLIAELEGDKVREAVGEKLGIDLSGRPTLVTLRSRCQARDGRIHADASFKLATLILYLNEPWMARGGRLRLLNSGTEMEDYAKEVAPDFGTLLCFKVQENSWHGHKPHEGPRRYIMMNYCASEELRDAEAARHRFSTRVKKVRRFFSLPGEAA
jgi:hypothetical protein